MTDCLLKLGCSRSQSLCVIAFALSTVAALVHYGHGLTEASCSLLSSQTRFESVPLSEECLVEAATKAGFQVREVRINIPRAAHSQVPFKSVDYDDKLLVTLKEQYPLQKVVSSARDEWTSQLLLKEWVHKAIPGGNPRVSARHSLEILKLAAQGESFYCTHYTITYVECALALGWQARKIGVDRKHGSEGMESTHHGVAEVWSNQFGKWVVIDAQSNLHFEKRGIPLSAWEIRSEWLKNHGADVDHMVGVPPKVIRKNPAIIWWNRSHEDETSAYFWLYVEDHAVSKGAEEPTRLIFPQDSANAGLIWYQNDDSTHSAQKHMGYLKNLFLSTNRIEDAYWTVGLVEPVLTEVSHQSIRLALGSYLPSRSGYAVSFDERDWQPVKDEKSLHWTLKNGKNSLRLRTVSQGDAKGPETSVWMRLEE